MYCLFWVKPLVYTICSETVVKCVFFRYCHPLSASSDLELISKSGRNQRLGQENTRDLFFNRK